MEIAAPVCRYRGREPHPFGPPIRQTQGKFFKERGEYKVGEGALSFAWCAEE